MPKIENKDQPWIENYPPLREFLRIHDARCDWQHVSAGTKSNPLGYVEQWRFPNGRTCIVVVHGRQHGWEVATGIDSNDVAETLGDLAVRCGLAQGGAGVPKFIAIRQDADGRPSGWGVAPSPELARAEADRQFDLHIARRVKLGGPAPVRGALVESVAPEPM